MKKTVMLMPIVFIFIASCDPALTKNMYDDEDDYDYEAGEDTYYDGEFENSTDYNYSYSYNYEEEAELNYVPELITRPQRIVVRQGETTELPCEANDSSQFVRIWMKGGTMLFTAEVPSVHAPENVNVGLSSFLKEEMSIEQEDNNDPKNPKRDNRERSSLIINNIQPNDVGEYTCRIMIRSTDEINVTHTIIVQKAGLSVITNPISGYLEVTEGGNASLSCELLDEREEEEEEENFRSIRSSRSLSIFTWTREGLQFSNSGKYTHLGTELNISNVTKSDAGFYFCTTESRNGELVSGQIQIQVSFPPKIISLQKSAIKTGKGLVAEIVCTAIGEPMPKITWYKGDEVMEPKDDGRISKTKSGVRHTLTINRVRTDDSGRYICYAVNELGSSQTSIELSTETQDLLDYDIEMIHDLDSRNSKNSLFDFSSSKKSPTVRLIQEVYEDLLKRSNQNNIAIQNIRDTIENEVSEMRNLTYQMLGESGGTLLSANGPFSSPDLDGLENQLFIDLRSIKIKLSEIENQYGKDISNLLLFEQNTNTDVHKLWDNVYDIQEIGNITSRNIEELYDKDILVLHNFRTETTNQITKLQNDIDSIITSAEKGSYIGISALGEQLEDGLEQSSANINSWNALSSLLESKLNLVKDEVKNLNEVLQKQQENDNVFRSQLQDVFEDVDNLKGRQRTMNQEQEKLKREIKRLKSQELIDLANRLDVHDENIEDLRTSQEKSNRKKNDDNTMDNEKLILVINEITKLKNQIYYLQRSVILLKNNGQISFGGGENLDDPNDSNGNMGDDASPTTILSTTNSFMTTELLDNPSIIPEGTLDTMVTQLSQQINECTPRAQFTDFSAEMEQKMTTYSDEIRDIKTRWRVDNKLVDNYIRRNVTKLNKRLTGVSKRLEIAENDAKRYNLIINGIPKTRKLERTIHLERLVKDFFQTVLSLPKVQFDEVQRIQHDTSASTNDGNDNKKEMSPILIKFPSVRIKTLVLKASRSMSKKAKRTYSVGEDFTNTVKHQRRRLVAFARKRARITKKKWALKYNELYMNGRVFIFNEERNRVVPKAKITVK